MRIGGAIMKPWKTAGEYMQLVKEMGYSAVVFPVDSSAPETLIKELKARLQDENILIGEVGIWKNLLDEDASRQEEYLQYSIRQLELAEKVGANCCVNISGSRGKVWDGFHADNYSRETRERVIRLSQQILDAVKPTHTSYSLEPMPWMTPDSPDDYLTLIREIDREAFRVHLDFCNMVNSLERYLHPEKLIHECFEKLGKSIVSIHIKDCLISDSVLPFAVSEVPVGKGSLPLSLVLHLADQLGEDIPLFTEHLSTHEDYVYSTRYLRSLAQKEKLIFK